MYVRKPIGGANGWVVIIAESISPLSKVIERIECSSREEAWQTYRRVMKELGRGL